MVILFTGITSHRKLLIYDALVLIGVTCLFFSFDSGSLNVEIFSLLIQGSIIFVLVFLFRFLFRVYLQIWRFGGAKSYIVLILSDLLAAITSSVICRIMPIQHVTLFKLISIIAVACLFTILMRMIYQFMYKTEIKNKKIAKFCNLLLNFFANGRVQVRTPEIADKIKIAIVGAGKLGVNLCNELLENNDSGYQPVMFIDTDVAKQGKNIEGIHVHAPNKQTLKMIKLLEVEEVVFAITNITEQHKSKLFDYYRHTDCKLKIYDNPILYASEEKQIRSIDVEDLLPRNSVEFNNNLIGPYFESKIVMVTGGGGSIGSEITRQVAFLNPEKVVLVDIAENGMYDVMQDVKMAVGDSIEVVLEVASVVDEKTIDTIFKKYKPNIVVHAAAHKHVPLMEHNCIEAIKNNIFGTKNVIECCEKYKVDKFMMVSTDKAVNPTNVMGATKRFCEMMVQTAAKEGKTSYASTRFGNVLGSAGSVVPLFRKQIANGGPVTITDKRIVRYFMTIPEACNLVLNATAMTENGDLFVLDMGQPVKILDLAENMIKLSGAKNIEIVETGLRPGEKLFEEILIEDKHFSKTNNNLIFVEKNAESLSQEEIAKHYIELEKVCETGNEQKAHTALRKAVPTFIDPDEANYKVIDM